MTLPSLSLSPGDRLGRYEILGLLGAGGMGEVYRARDPDLHRDVAVKVLQRSSASAEDIARFSREARAAGSLNHPNIVAVFDVGTEAGVPYVVTELLEGETLRARLDRGPLPYRKAVEYGIQIARALDAVHAKGIWHRDVKPANAFVTDHGPVKLLDFGIAKLGERTSPVPSDEPTQEVGQTFTLGTLGYMSPEQVLRQAADHRADIFGFGAVLYEMFTHARAFKRASAEEIRTAVLHEDPVNPLMLNRSLPPAAAAIVRRCLEKNKEERFQSARDLAFALQQLHEQTEPKPPAPEPVVRSTWIWAIGAVCLLLAAALGWSLTKSPVLPSFDQLTFGRARISAARFVADGRAVVYSEAHQGNELRLWQHDLSENPPTRPLDFQIGTDVLAARAGQLALLVNRRFIMGERFVGTLALVPLEGGGPREREENVEDADWDRSGAQLALVRSTGGIGGRSWLEYPAGTRRYETSGSIRFARLSRDGRRIAFLEDSIGSGEGGVVSVLELNGNPTPTKLTANLKSARGLAWSADGNEVWFAAGASRSNRTLHAVTTRGTDRVVLMSPGSLTLWDIAADGRVLLTRDEERRSIIGVWPSQGIERDLSWFDDSGLADVSDDGRWLLFSDRFGVYRRETTGAMPVWLGLNEAYGDDLSPDGKQVLATRRTGAELIIVPIGAGPQQQLPAHQIVGYRGARWLPDGRRILFSGIEAGHDLRTYIQDVNGGAPQAVTPEHVWAIAVSPDGQLAAAISDIEPGISLWPLSGGKPRPVPGSQKGDRPVTWSADGRSLWIFRRGEVPTDVIKLEIATGNRVVWKKLIPTDAAGVHSITEFAITPDGLAYFYSYSRVLSQLYLVHGLK